MPYIYDSVTDNSDASSTFSVSVPEGHESGDLILAIVSQNGGGTTIAASGYTDVAAQAAVQGQRTAALYKIAASSAEADIALTGATDTWVVTVMVIKAVDSADPFNVALRSDDSGTADNSTITGVTTDENNTLVIYAHGRDGGRSQNVSDPNALVFVGKSITVANVQIVGYRNQVTAGLTPDITVLSDIASESGNGWCIAINDNDPSNPTMGSDCREAYEVVKRYGGITSAAAGVSAMIRHDSITWLAASTLTATAIDGISIIDFTVTENTNTPLNSTWAQATGINVAGSALDDTGRFGGFVHALSSHDMSGKIFSIEMAAQSFTSLIGSKGFIVVFEDGSGNWAAFQLAPNTNRLSAATLYTYYIDVENGTVLDSSGTMDWTDVVYVGYLFHKVTTATTAREMRIKNAILLDRTTVIGGSSASPANATTVEAIMRGWGTELGSLQGSGQALWRSGLRLGDGTNKTYVGSSGVSHELPLSLGTSLRRRFWNVPAQSDAAETRIYASASDTIRYRNTILSTTVRQKFYIDPSSSSSATYDFSGTNFIGYDIYNDIATFNSANFTNCQLTLNGGGLDGCVISSPSGTPAVTTDDPSNITNTAFTSAGTGHAITATATGTFAFEGNTFSGYGADSTTDAVFYNNSGGLITLEIPATDTPPTVRNGAGASTVIDTPTDNQSVTISGATAGSRIQIYDLTSSTELYNGTPTFPYTWTDSNPYAADREIRLRVAYVNGTSAKQFIDTVIGTSTAANPALSYLVNQENDSVYNTNAVDGSTITTVTVDDANLLVEVDTGSISIKDIYAYEMYWLFTATGIADEGKAIVAADTANYAIYGFQIKNVTDPSVPLTITGGWVTDGDTGQAIDIVDTSGGTIFLAPDHVVAYATGSGVTSGDVTDIANAVNTILSDDFDAIPTASENATAIWSDSTAYTSGQKGKLLTDAADDADTAANK